ncbi:cytochrome c oxidase assembly protein [Sedimenticola hydrogenitrophicus]|uniref:cytochrome c oxidase assembly protein n=1 Tax=Sedimenticola hydrogenitrophicus TaxID=2967975 RepID=UPI0023B11C01|nr:cytochrome c oxidase assembly protein [Sedimenticola hydrogenitrophicus]
MNPAAQARNKRRTVWLLSLLVLGMFGFGFALMPLYDLLCQVTGIQSVSLRSAGEAVAEPLSIREDSRLITIKFDTSVHPNLPWDFQPLERHLQVHPGKLYQVNFAARNRSSASVTGQAIPSVAPWQATAFLNKLECFCFNRQTLAGGASVEMPLRFMISPDLPPEIRSLTLSYSLMKPETPAPELAPELAPESAPESARHEKG